MPAPASVNEFLELVHKSGLVDPAALQQFLRNVRAAANVPTTPRDLAALFVRDQLLTDFQVEQFLLGKWRGFRVGEYIVLRPIGAGGMASVYLCERPGDRKKVAVKVLPKERAEDSEIRKRFQREGRTVSTLDHPNIIRAFEMGLDEKRHFLVMEYIDGPNLDQYVKKHGVPEIPKACDIIRQAAVGLEHIDFMDLIHRDIKPANLLIDAAGHVKIFDMGLALVFGDQQEILTRKVVGTADFIAPEQTFDSHQVDIRADIYGLGMTFYFLLTGSLPFTTGTVVQKILAHRTKQPTPISALRPAVPKDLVAIVDKMIAKEPARRYQEPGDVVEVLKPWCAGS
jgi:serine/threonine protein kinase